MNTKLPDFYYEDPEQLVLKKELRLSLNEEIVFLTKIRDKLKKEIEELKEKNEEIRLDYERDEIDFIPYNPSTSVIQSIATNIGNHFNGGQSGGGGSNNSW